jgi:hypothetical protein
MTTKPTPPAARRMFAPLALSCMLAAAVSNAAADPGAAAGGPWSLHSHTCPGGNRTDALHRDADGTLWLGCGTNATGYGLFRSTDGGSGWQPAAVSPADAFDQFRVMSISRGHDGALYAAGFTAVQGSLLMVQRVATGAAPFVASATLVGVNQVGRQFPVGSYRELADGRAIAEALNGTNLLYRPTAGTGSSAAAWTRELGTVQILDLVVHDDRFWGAGSLINQPPRVFLPPQAPASPPWQFQTLDLQPGNGWKGELWALAVNAHRLVAVGVNQDDDTGRIFVSGADPYQLSGYSELSMSAITGDAATWARGVCMRNDRVVVVGERQPLGSGSGRVLISNDGGDSFADITPAGIAASVSRCVIEPDGTVVVAGAAQVGIRLDPDWIFVDDLERR